MLRTCRRVGGEIKKIPHWHFFTATSPLRAWVALQTVESLAHETDVGVRQCLASGQQYSVFLHTCGDGGDGDGPGPAAPARGTGGAREEHGRSTAVLVRRRGAV